MTHTLESSRADAHMGVRQLIAADCCMQVICMQVITCTVHARGKLYSVKFTCNTHIILWGAAGHQHGQRQPAGRQHAQPGGDALPAERPLAGLAGPAQQQPRQRRLGFRRAASRPAAGCAQRQHRQLRHQRAGRARRRRRPRRRLIRRPRQWHRVRCRTRCRGRARSEHLRPQRRCVTRCWGGQLWPRPGRRRVRANSGSWHARV